MEPTAYAILALRAATDSKPTVDLALQRIQRWRKPDGSWRPGSQVEDSTWVTALGVLLAPDRQGVQWLLGMSGRESRWTVRVASYFHFLKTEVNVNHRGWPWRPGNSAWIEPTALTLLALKKAQVLKPDAAVRARIEEGEELLFSRRGRDGGWSAGNPNVLNVDVPSYPETTAMALLGLQGRRRAELASPLGIARRYYRDRKSSLATAWLEITLRCYGEALPAPADKAGVHSDVYLCALQALGPPDGNHRVFRMSGTA